MAPPVESCDPAGDLARHGIPSGALVALAPAAGGIGLATSGLAVWHRGDPLPVLEALLARTRPRLVWWRARDVADLLAGGLRPGPVWDLGAVHRLLHGGSDDDPALVWAAVSGADPARRPRTGQLDLLGAGPAEPGAGPAPWEDPAEPHDPVRPDGHLRPEWARSGPPDPVAAAGWAATALRAAAFQHTALAVLPDHRRTQPAPPLPVLTAWSESAAELLALELGHTGLPIDLATAGRLIAERVGPPPADEGAAAAARQGRDDRVRRHVPGGEDCDLRNPAQVRALLARAGIDVPDTRSWRLEPFRDAHPVVAALLEWRKAERIATTYGWSWLDRHVGADGRLRGSWTGCDGAGGRMTASSGLHNLPAELRPAVAAEPGHVLVRADQGQVEPRVLAAVSGDGALAAATAEDDLYAPVARRLGCTRPVAKVAVLAAMYGQTSGTAGAALAGLDRAYPVAMRHLRAAAEEGRAGVDLRTYGGRLLRMWPLPSAAEPSALAARGRFARNAVVQGAAAELFKMWAVSVRAGLPDGAAVVLCLHDELLVHAPAACGPDVVALLHEALATTAARWAAGSGVRFVADVSVLRRWSEAKG